MTLASTTRRAVLAISLALAAVLGALPAPSAEAGVRSFRLGVMSGYPPPPHELERMQGVGVRTVRVSFFWRAIESRRPRGRSCQGAEYHGFKRYAGLVSEASDRGKP